MIRATLAFALGACCFATCGAFSAAAFAAEQATIHLVDGSKIVGELKSLSDGTYLIEAESLGRIEIPQQQVQTIRYGGAPSERAQSMEATEPNAQQLESLRANLLANPALLSIVRSVQEDPGFQAAAADPEIQRAIAAGDYLSLMNNPRIRALMEHDAVKAISAEVTR